MKKYAIIWDECPDTLSDMVENLLNQHPKTSSLHGSPWTSTTKVHVKGSEEIEWFYQAVTWEEESEEVST